MSLQLSLGFVVHATAPVRLIVVTHAADIVVPLTLPPSGFRVVFTLHTFSAHSSSTLWSTAILLCCQRRQGFEIVRGDFDTVVGGLDIIVRHV